MSSAHPSFHAAVRRYGYRGLQDALHEAAIDTLADHEDEVGDELAEWAHDQDTDDALSDDDGAP